MNKKILYWGLLIILLIIIAGIIKVNLEKTDDTYKTPQPAEAVRQYFTAWSNKNYPDMYATISDGFKKIDPNAKDLTAFRNFADSQGIQDINIINIKEKSNDGTTAQVDYSVEFILNDGNKRNFIDTFTLKYKTGDVIPGWKLIHPYGANIDND